MTTRQRLLALGAALALAGVAACGGPAPTKDGADGRGKGGVGTDVVRPSPTRTAWPEPSPGRPVVDLRFEVAPDLATVTGTETVTFVPDLDICEVVFRAWPNKPATAAWGNALLVTGMTIGGVPAEPVGVPAGAPEGWPSTLVEAPLQECVTAGTMVTVDMTFEVRLGTGTDERVGVSRSGDLAWLGTAYPLLAWESGVGWARDEAVSVPGEMVTSETFDLRSLEVGAPTGYAVVGVGQSQGTREDPDAGRTWHRFTAPALRDVTVTVGRMEVVEREVGGIRVHLGIPAGTRATADEWLDRLAASATALRAYLGPFPYEDLWVSVIPDQSEGIEYAGAVQFGDLRLGGDTWLVTHELAHMWFYGLVGNNQARDPWLDESFASFAQAVADDPTGDPRPGRDYPNWVVGSMGQPMSFWAEQERPGRSYVDGVYLAGSDALIAARRAAGAGAFDVALRDYLDANAHAVATPADVREAFADLPAALDVLEAAGAFPEGPGG